MSSQLENYARDNRRRLYYSLRRMRDLQETANSAESKKPLRSESMDRKLERLMNIADKLGVNKADVMDTYYVANQHYITSIETPPKPMFSKDFCKLSEEWYDRSVHYSQRQTLNYIREKRCQK